jgi:hypothetical protein
MNLSFREPSTEQELKALLDLRSGVYNRERSLQHMVSGNDITEFDLHSLHFGAFDGERPVAYMRMVQRDQTRFTPWVQNIAGHIDELPFPADFPFELYSPYKTWNKQFLRNLSGKKIGEAGKLAIHEDYRKDGTLEHFIRAFVDYCNETRRFDSGFGVCTFKLERFYRRLGFRRAEGAVPFIYSDLPEAVVLQFDRKPSPYYIPDLSHRLSYQFPG